MDSETHSHLMKIVRCPLVERCLKGENNHQCSKLVKSQEKNKEGLFHIPTPWLGNLKSAPILILSSNPSIDEGELYPTGQLENGFFQMGEQWKDDATLFDYFNNFFDGTQKKWVEHRRVLRKDGIERGDKNRYWGAVGRLTRELLERPATLGTDVAITEVVRCKSKKEKFGVAEAMQHCPDQYLEQTLQLSGARVIICAGKMATHVFRKHYKQFLPEGIPPDAHRNGHIVASLTIAGKERYVAFMPHLTGARGHRTFIKLFTLERSDQLQKLREFLRNNSAATRP
jgi:hypothetical protein